MKRDLPATTTFNMADVQAARKLAAASGRSIPALLAETWQCPPREAMHLLALGLHYPFLDSASLLDAVPDFAVIPLARALQRRCVALTLKGESWIALTDPFDLHLLNWLEARCSKRSNGARLALMDEGDLHALLTHAEADVRAVDSNQSSDDEIDLETRGEELSLVGIEQDASSVVRLVNSTLYDALKSGASDLHFETTPAGIEVKYRIDGVLDLATTVAGRALAEQTISRIKVLAELDIAERRVPQDGRFRVTVGGRTTDLRVSIMPSIHGEDAVLRILDKRQLVPAGGKLTLNLLGFDSDTLQRIRSLAALPYGMLLVTGPTGSGKTTTLYGAISETWTGRDKIVTIEDPVEYELAGVLQIPVNEKKGLSFARGLRSILRHDPDRIMVGEIRDGETAEIAVQSALTGHLVLSTVHANSVFDIFSRFAHMGVDTHALVAALNGVVAQRLLRAVCPQCAVSYSPTAVTCAAVGLTIKQLSGARLLHGHGCGDCRGTGYKGRRAVAEILTMNDQLREAIVARASIVTIKALAAACGTKSLRQAALALAIKGETTLEEVLRVTMQELT